MTWKLSKSINCECNRAMAKAYLCQSQLDTISTLKVLILPPCTLNLPLGPNISVLVADYHSDNEPLAMTATADCSQASSESSAVSQP